MTGDLDMGNNQIENLGTPFAPADATTKTYVDTADALKLDLSGGTMTGDIDMGGQMVNNLGTPVSSTDAATKGLCRFGIGRQAKHGCDHYGGCGCIGYAQEYGSYGTPETGNISVSLTNAVRGIDQIVYHDDTVAPTIVVAGGTAVKFGTAGYDLTKVNVIVFWFMGGTNVGYIITPAV
jgi:hypothetical protein